MKLFIGWSGETGGKIAPILQNWLTRMFDDHITIFSFTSSIETGSLWRDSVEEAVSAADCSLLCVTEDSVNSPWLAYAAGKSRKGAQSFLLFGVDASRLDAIFHGFHAISFDNFDGMLELTRTLNKLLGADALPEEELERRFPARYPALEGLVQYTLEENELQTREEWERNELDEISTQLAELTKRVERLKKNISAANSPRKYSYRKIRKTSPYM